MDKRTNQLPAYTSSSSIDRPALVVPGMAFLAEDPFVSSASWRYGKKKSKLITYTSFSGLEH
jgi:hypothetical protein